MHAPLPALLSGFISHFYFSLSEQLAFLSLAFRGSPYSFFSPSVSYLSPT
jgi:hypothetical protein